MLIGVDAIRESSSSVQRLPSIEEARRPRLEPPRSPWPVSSRRGEVAIPLDGTEIPSQDIQEDDEELVRTVRRKEAPRGGGDPLLVGNNFG
jgi:hypothetical protein